LQGEKLSLQYLPSYENPVDGSGNLRSSPKGSCTANQTRGVYCQRQYRFLIPRLHGSALQAPIRTFFRKSGTPIATLAITGMKYYEGISDPSGGAVEQRRAIRFTLHARVNYSWKDRSGRNQEGVGHTRDISILGVFVVCLSPPSVGAPVGLEIHLPPLERNALEHLRLEAKGKVTRVAHSDQGSGFASTSRFELHEIVF